MLYGLFILIYLFIVILMIAVILVQRPRGGGLSSALGGSGIESFLGVRGAPTFFTKLTAVLGGLFLVLSLLLSLMHPTQALVKSAIEKEVKKGLNLPPIPGVEEEVSPK